MKKRAIKYKVNPSLTDVGREIYEEWKLLNTRPVNSGNSERENPNRRIETRAKTLVDREKFVKIFVEGGDFLNKYIELTLTAQRILNYIIGKLDTNQHKVYLYNNVIVRDLKMSDSLVSRGLSELIENDWIFHTDIPKMYWINVSRVFNGDREKTYKEFKTTVLE